MKRSCVLLFVMSIIFLLLSALAAISYFDLINSRSQLAAIEQTADNGIALTLAKAAVEVDVFLVVVILAATLVLGLIGIIGSVKNGRLSVLCIAFDALPLAYILFGTVSFMLQKNDLYKDYFIVLLFLALHMAGAVVAFKGRKKAA